MLIRFTETGSKSEMFFSAEQIRCVQSAPGNPLACIIITNWLTPQGFQSFECLGTAENVAREVNQALAGKNLLLQ